jgi:hypothetical protein
MELRKYRVHTPLPGVDATDPCHGCISIPMGAILAIVRECNHPTMYVNVQWNNREFLVFPQDLSQYTFECYAAPMKRLKAKAAGA